MVFSKPLPPKWSVLSPFKLFGLLAFSHKKFWYRRKLWRNSKSLKKLKENQENFEVTSTSCNEWKSCKNWGKLKLAQNHISGNNHWGTKWEKFWWPDCLWNWKHRSSPNMCPSFLSFPSKFFWFSANVQFSPIFSGFLTVILGFLLVFYWFVTCSLWRDTTATFTRRHPMIACTSLHVSSISRSRLFLGRIVQPG